MLVGIAFVVSGVQGGVDTPIPSEMTANYVTSVFSMFNMVNMSPGTFVPYVVGLALEAGPNLLIQWNIVWWVSAFLTLVTAIVVFVFVRAEREPWDKLEQDLSPIVVDDEVKSTTSSDKGQTLTSVD